MALIIECRDSGCASDLMRVLIRLTAPMRVLISLTAPAVELSKVAENIMKITLARLSLQSRFKSLPLYMSSFLLLTATSNGFARMETEPETPLAIASISNAARSSCPSAWRACSARREPIGVS